MKQFNVLDKDLEVYSDYLLEASAGTGKTFSIENIFVRLLLEPHPKTGVPLKIHEILVVTFTRAATRDLVMRIRQNIVSAIDRFAENICDKDDYIAAIQSGGSEAVERSIRSLEDALFCFDQAQIYTIHGFCSKMLREHVFEGNMSLDTNFTDQLSTVDIQTVIKNVIRSEVCHKKYCSEQLNIALKSCMGQYEKLEHTLMKLILQDCDIASTGSFIEDFQSFKDTLKEVQQRNRLKGAWVWSDYEKQKSFFKKPRSPDDPDASVADFCELLDKETITEGDFRRLIADGLVLVDALSPSQRKKTGSKEETPLELHYPDIVEILQASIYPYIAQARSPEVILTRLAFDCKCQLKRYCDHEEKINFGDFLQHMLQAVGNPSFKELVQRKFFVAIIDEFQDTDPVQWDIFRELFLSSDNSHFLYLVGDPKQAIYSFRQADIYTYLSAAEAMGKEHLASLDTNYRSTSEMIDALNFLFDKSTTPGLIPLPRISRTLPYHPVKAGKDESTPDFGDDLRVVNFCAAYTEVKRSNSFPIEQLEADYFFPFITSEIQKIHKTGTVSYKGMAVLVSDRYQAERLSQFLYQHKVPYALQRSISLAESPALPALKEILLAAIDPRDESAIKTALGGQILQFTHSELLTLQNSEEWVSILEAFYLLRKELFEKGFSSFYEKLLYCRWSDRSFTTIEGLLSKENGLEFYDDMQQIAEILMEYHAKVKPAPDGLISYIDEFETMSLNDDSQVKRRRDPNRDAVVIITMHSSKGLEYDVVFTLAAIKRTSSPPKIFPAVNDKERYLKPTLSKEDQDYLAYCREIDAEKMRQLYVGMTRAKYRLYIPIAFVAKSKTEIGCASPMELFISKFGYEDAKDDAETYERINAPDHSRVIEFTKQHPHISYIEVDKLSVSTGSGIELPAPPILIEPKRVEIPGYDLFMQSFSSLTRTHSSSSITDEPAPVDFLAEDKSPYTLPAGSETGNLLHLILETLDFQSSNLEEHIYKYTKNTKYEDWTPAIHQIVLNVLDASIGEFKLKSIPTAATYREMEFVYPISSATPYVEEVDYLPGYLKGIIDLVLQHDDHYYVIDWKSNWLGHHAEDYSVHTMRESVLDHQYHLQASFYREALKKYLALVDPRPFETIYGGAYYIYLRGVSSEHVNTGIICMEQEFCESEVSKK